MSKQYPEANQTTINAIRKCFKLSEYGSESTFEFQTKKDGYYIKVEQMYSYVEFANGSVLQTYIKIAKLLGVQDGDEISRFYHEGCETCDYGSSYSLELKFW